MRNSHNGGMLPVDGLELALVHVELAWHLVSAGTCMEVLETSTFQ